MIWLRMVPFWAWVLIGATVAVFGAYARGRYDGRAACEAAVAVKIAAERQKAQERVDAADEAGARSVGKIREVETRYVDRIKTVVRDGPCLDVDVVREVKAADSAVAQAPGKRD